MRLDNGENFQSNMIASLLIIFMFMILIAGMLFLNSCTLTMQNTIATGSSDVVDSTPTNTPEVTTDVTLPIPKL